MKLFDPPLPSNLGKAQEHFLDVPTIFLGGTGIAGSVLKHHS